MTTKRVGISDLVAKKAKGEKITMITAYNAPFANLVDEANIDIILIGDSLGMVELGYESTVPVTLDQMIHHTKAVATQAKRPMLITDVPFGSFEASDEQAIATAIRMVKDGGSQAVKIEGGNSLVLQRIKAVVDAGVPVMAHLGLTPQTASLQGGYKVQGKTAKVGNQIRDQAHMLEEIGVFSLLFECMPTELVEKIVKEITVPIIGIGAGPACDGQVIVIHDMLGLSSMLPKHARRYVNLRELILEALVQYREDTKNCAFPGEENTFHMTGEELNKLY